MGELSNKRDLETRFGEADTPSGLTDDETKIIRMATHDGLGPNSIAGRMNTYTSSVTYILSLPHIQQRIRNTHENAFQTTLANKSMAALEEILDDETASQKVKFDVSKYILDRIGVGVDMAGNKGREALGFDPDTPLTEMNLRELQSFISAGNAALNVMRQPVEKNVSDLDGEWSDLV